MLYCRDPSYTLRLVEVLNLTEYNGVYKMYDSSIITVSPYKALGYSQNMSQSIITIGIADLQCD